MSFELPGEDRAIQLVDLMHGGIYELPENMVERREDGVTGLLNLPLTDSPLLLTFGDFIR